MYNLTIEYAEMNTIIIRGEGCEPRFYDLNKWSVGQAVENYIEYEMQFFKKVIIK